MFRRLRYICSKARTGYRVFKLRTQYKQKLLTTWGYAPNVISADDGTILFSHYPQVGKEIADIMLAHYSKFPEYFPDPAAAVRNGLGDMPLGDFLPAK